MVEVTIKRRRGQFGVKKTRVRTIEPPKPPKSRKLPPVKTPPSKLQPRLDALSALLGQPVRAPFCVGFFQEVEARLSPEAFVEARKLLWLICKSPTYARLLAHPKSVRYGLDGTTVPVSDEHRADAARRYSAMQKAMHKGKPPS